MFTKCLILTNKRLNFNKKCVLLKLNFYSMAARRYSTFINASCNKFKIAKNKKSKGEILFENEHKHKHFHHASSKGFYSHQDRKTETLQKHFTVLGIDKNFTKEEVKNSFLKLTKKYHPDINNDDSANKKFQEIKNSYEILINYFNDENNAHNTNKEDLNEREIDTIISNLFSKKISDFHYKNSEKDNVKEDVIRETKEDEMKKEKKIRLFSLINETLNKNVNSIDIYDFKIIKKNYKKLRSRLDRLEMAKTIMNTANQINLDNKVNNKKNNDPNENSSFSSSKIGSSIEEDKKKKLNMQVPINNNKYMKMMKTITHKLYEILIKLVVVYCLCSFIYYTYNKKIAYILGFYLLFMILTT